jgi:hypothetical protein
MNSYKINNLFLNFICNQDLLSEEIIKYIKENPVLESLFLNEEYTIESKFKILTCEKFCSRFNYIISLSKDLDLKAIFNFTEKDFFKYYELNIVSKYLQLLDDINYFENEINKKNIKIVELKNIKALSLANKDPKKRDSCKNVFFETKKELKILKAINNNNKNRITDLLNLKDLLIIVMQTYKINFSNYTEIEDISDTEFFEKEKDYDKVFENLNIYENYIKNYLELINRTLCYKNIIKSQEERPSTPVYAVHQWP